MTAVGALLVLAYCTLSSALDRSNVPAPLAFVVAGGLLGLVGAGGTAQEVLWVLAVAEATLVLVLFHDAAVVPSATP